MATRLKLTNKQIARLRTEMFNRYVTKRHKKRKHRKRLTQYICAPNSNSDCFKLTIVASIFLVVLILILIHFCVNYSYDWSADHFIIENIHNHTFNELHSFWKCFTNGIEQNLFDNGYQCMLNKKEIILNHELGRGGQGAVYSVNINSSQFALKHSYAKDFCYHLKREWITLQHIGSNPYILHLHEKLSNFYETETHCFIFLQLINNSITMFDLLEYHANRLQKLRETTIHKIEHQQLQELEWTKDRNKLLIFVLNCYEDIKNALDVLRGELIFYSDELIHNVLLNIDNNHCVLIDFGLVAEMRDSLDILSETKHLDHKMKYSPYSAYYLHSFDARKTIMNKFVFEWQGIKKLQQIATWNMLHKIAAFALRVFVSFYLDVIKESEYYSYVNQSSFRELDGIKTKLYDVDKIRRWPAGRYWAEREKEINLIKMQINELNGKHQFFNSDLTAQFFEILDDIHTDKSMHKCCRK